MIYTRRKLLRDATTASFASAACSAFPVLSQTGARPKPFGSGVRIFFIGTWLFCKDQAPGQNGVDQLLAITRDDNMGHTFPYGPWNGDTFDQDYGPGLPESTTPHVVGVSDYTTNFKFVVDAFADAASNCEFVYATLPKGNFPPTFKSSGMRVVSLPLPTKLYTGIYSGGSISSSDMVNYPVKGAKGWSAHVFEYAGGTLTDKTLNVTLQPSPDFKGDFHFHTVSPPCTCHGPQMFAKLFNAVFPNIANGAISLQSACPEDAPDPGNYLPITVSDAELDIKDLSCPTKGSAGSRHRESMPPNQRGNKSMVNRTPASCAGAGMGVIGS